MRCPLGSSVGLSVVRGREIPSRTKSFAAARLRAVIQPAKRERKRERDVNAARHREIREGDRHFIDLTFI